LITPFGCALRSVGVARARTLRLLRAADVFDARLDRFVAISFLRCCIADVDHRRDELVMAGLRHYRRFRAATKVMQARAVTKLQIEAPAHSDK